MKNAFHDILTDRGGNYILPFFWMRGESEAAIREEMLRVRECGIRAVCVEARPHPDFLGPKWWRDLDVVLDEARRHDMKVWILDDVHFPTGIANHAFRDRHPDKAKIYLAERHMDVLGPQKNGTVLIAPFLGQEGELIGILACPRPDGHQLAIDLNRAVDLTDRLHDGLVEWDVPAGFWRIFVLYRTRLNGGREHYMNLISRESVRVLLDEVYEPHYRRYQADFGRTIAGFFSDEPELGNVPGYDFDEQLGRVNRRLPWSAELDSWLRTKWQARFLLNLPALWFDGGSDTGAVRFQYMDAVTRLVADCFSGQVGNWCAGHGVEYIGHLIEDDNAHGRLGCSLGHYFRGLSGQHMAGIDVVLLQIIPGFDQTIHQWIASDRDGEFFHYALAKLGSSHAHIDPKKQGRAMCEIYGAYGWAEDISLMKFLTDHMLVHGINVFVPHAFSPRQFPDPDCPPHFYAHGKNPQFRHFSPLMRYTNRLAHLLNGGRHLAQAAVLYHGEAEWAGEAMLTQKPVRVLLQHQIDCDILPADALAGLVPTAERSGWFRIGPATYGALIIPYARSLPRTVIDRLIDLGAQGVRILFVGGYPQEDSEIQPFTVSDHAGTANSAPVDKVWQLPCVSLDELAAALIAEDLQPVRVPQAAPWLRTMVYQRDGMLCLMLMNQHPSDRLDSQMVVCLKGLAPDLGLDLTSLDQVYAYDAMENKVYTPPATLAAGERLGMPIRLEPGQSRFYILIASADAGRILADADIAKEDRPMPDEQPMTGWPILQACKWHLTKTTSEAYPAFEVLTALPADTWPNLNGPGQNPTFSGYFRYETTFCLDELALQQLAGRRAWLRLDLAKDGAEVLLNGETCGLRIAAPYLFDLTPQLRPGLNTLAIEVANTLAWELRDGQSTHMLWKPTGLLAEPKVLCSIAVFTDSAAPGPSPARPAL